MLMPYLFFLNKQTNKIPNKTWCGFNHKNELHLELEMSSSSLSQRRQDSIIKIDVLCRTLAEFKVYLS